MVAKKSRPSCINLEIDQLQSGDHDLKTNYSVLGRIHLDLAKYHELRRFMPDGESSYDKVAAMFHLEQAAKCGILEAVLTLARICMQLPHDFLVEVELPVGFLIF